MAEHCVSAPETCRSGPRAATASAGGELSTLDRQRGCAVRLSAVRLLLHGASAHAAGCSSPPSSELALPNTLLLLLSSLAAWWGERGIIKGRRGQALVGFGVRFPDGRRFVVRCNGSSGARNRIVSALRATPRCISSPRDSHAPTSSWGWSCWRPCLAWTALDYFSPRRRMVVAARRVVLALRRRGLAVRVSRRTTSRLILGFGR